MAKIVIVGEARPISLTKGLVALVSPEDWLRTVQYMWYADVNQWTTYGKTDQLPNRPRLHVFLMQPPLGYVVHHADGDGLNCTRSNMESITQSEHSRLSRARKNRTNTYRGVHKRRSDGKYTSEIWVDYKKYYLGIYHVEEEAAMAYDTAATLLLGAGKFIPNFPQG